MGGSFEGEKAMVSAHSILYRSDSFFHPCNFLLNFYSFEEYFNHKNINYRNNITYKRTCSARVLRC